MKVAQTDEEEYVEYGRKEEFINSFNELLQNWHNSFYTETLYYYPQFNYYIIDNKTGNILTNTIEPLNQLTENTQEAQEKKSSYPFYMIFQFGEDGRLQVSDFKGLEQTQIDELFSMNLNKEIMHQDSYVNSWYQYYDQIGSPSDVTIIYASQADKFYNNGTDFYNFHNEPMWAFSTGGFQYLFGGAFLLILLLALLLPLIKPLEIGKGFASKLPLEVSAAGILIIIATYREVLSIAWETSSGSFLSLPDYMDITSEVQHGLDYGINLLVWIIVLLIWYVGMLSIRQVFSLGLKRYLKEKTLTVKIFKYLFNIVKKLFRELGNIDLTQKSNKAIIKILAVNFVILTLLCSIWFIGIAILIPYTIILFFILRKYFDDIKKKYALLLEATSGMAEGNLEAPIEEDLGVFEPLKVELTKVQSGFKKAVEEEMKSQRMKTELITNVSHDLKTPLTAIITYVSLLKEGNGTEEERNSYIDTIDKKSQRLKRLIEDLFEISKASSNNIALNLVEIDLVDLIKQVVLELDDKIVQSEIDFRYDLPEKKVILTLDSEKTYRIFENLIINITKYAMPHTRAYIDMKLKGDSVVVTLKNVSDAELNINAQEISERFVRGDVSRNTEGSGLGLAIVKSFVELQDGKLQIIADGDLFKVMIEWKIPRI
jgi:signal transduction histidine kinase